MEYSTIANLSAKGIAARVGDCGVQGSVFITLCRAAGVPARWQSGWQTKPGRSNMHDWSEFYVEPWGWLPADASNGVQEHGDPRVRDFFCGHLDPYRFIVNLDYGRPLDPPKLGLRSEPNDFQRGEVEIDGHNLYFDEWQYEIDVRTMPLDGGMASLEEALDAVLPKPMKAGNVSGAVIAAGRRTAEGYEIWQKAYGLMQTQPEPSTMPVDAVFDLASMTKPIATGTSLMILVEQGRVGLDDPVGKYLPEFNTEEKKAVTIRHLMTHTSGMPPYVGESERKPIQDEAGFPCPEAIRRYIRTMRLSGIPAKRWCTVALMPSCAPRWFKRFRASRWTSSPPSTSSNRWACTRRALIQAPDRGLAACSPRGNPMPAGRAASSRDKCTIRWRRSRTACPETPDCSARPPTSAGSPG